MTNRFKEAPIEEKVSRCQDLPSQITGRKVFEVGSPEWEQFLAVCRLFDDGCPNVFLPSLRNEDEYDQHVDS